VTPLEFIYYTGYRMNKGYVSNHSKRLPHKVISLGNITVGGAGKTPAAMAMAEEAKKRGYSPVILTRGYRGKAKGPCFVTTAGDMKTGICSSVEEAGDEPVLMAERLRDVPVVKCADRYAGGMFALEALRPAPTPFLFILDDGFQHWRLSRDVDIVLIDGLNPFGNRRLLPMGPLREPLSELRRANLFVVTKVRNQALCDELAVIAPGRPSYFAEYEVQGLRDGAGRHVPLEEVRGRKVYAFCGIANPASFIKTLEARGFRLQGIQTFRDHHAYTMTDLASLSRRADKAGCDFVVTTEKDMVKLRSMELPGNLLCLQVRWNVEEGFFNEVFMRIEQ